MLNTENKMGKTKFLIAIMLVFLTLNFVSASDLSTINKYESQCAGYGAGGYVITPIVFQNAKINQDFYVWFRVYDANMKVITSNTSVNCSVYMWSPDSKRIYALVGNEQLTSTSPTAKRGMINASFINETGEHPWFVGCEGPVFGGCFEGTLDVTPTGDELSLEQTLLYIFLLTALSILLAFSIYGINKAENGAWQIFYICLSYVILFSGTFILWLISNNYLYGIPLLEKILWIIWIILGVMFLPFLIGVSSYILKKEAEEMEAAELVKQGYSPEDAREMSKKHKRG